LGSRSRLRRRSIIIRFCFAGISGGHTTTRRFPFPKKKQQDIRGIQDDIIKIIAIICISDISVISDIILRKCYNKNNSNNMYK
jgi:hypothetical protein